MEGFLKRVKLNESSISMVLGILVIAVVGILVINYFRSSNGGGTSSDATSTEVAVETTVYVVQPGDNLSTISEKHYGDRLKWLAIAEANNITNPNLLEKGQELIIPVLGATAVNAIGDRLSESNESETPTVIPTVPVDNSTTTPEPTAMPTIESTATPTAEVTMTPSPTETVEPVSKESESKTYEVQVSDSLWSIAVNAYGNGYRWVDIAKANNLSNPNVIHHGNILVLPN